MSGELTEVVAAVASVAHFLDAKCWSELRALYADQVEVDYVSLFGGTPQLQSADSLISGWRTALTSVVTQHLLGPVDVALSADSATARCHVRAFHYAAQLPDGESWEVLGHYHFGLTRTPRGWRVARMKLDVLHQLGNLQLLAQAAPHAP